MSALLDSLEDVIEQAWQRIQAEGRAKPFRPDQTAMYQELQRVVREMRREEGVYE